MPCHLTSPHKFLWFLGLALALLAESVLLRNRAEADQTTPPGPDASSLINEAPGPVVEERADRNVVLPHGDKQTPSGSVMRLIGNQMIRGDLVPSANPQLLRWQGDSFRRPFDFSRGVVEAIYFPDGGQTRRPQGEFLVELANGDILYANLTAIDAEEIHFDSPRFGSLAIQRTHVRRIARSGNEGEYLFVSRSLADWDCDDPALWKPSGDSIRTGSTARIGKEFDLPEQVTIDVELSWSTRPDFCLTIGAPHDDHLEQAFSLEVWGSDIVVQREVEREFDCASVLTLDDQTTRLALRLYVDQTSGRMLVFHASGRLLADLTVATNEVRLYHGIMFANRSQDVAVRHLAVRRWLGWLPQGGEAGVITMQTADGQPAEVDDVILSPGGTRALTVLRGDRNFSLPLAELAALTFAARPEAATPALTAIYREGSRISGELTEVQPGALLLRVPGSREPWRIPLDGLRSLEFASPAHGENRVTPELPAPSRKGRLELMDTRLEGYLVPGPDVGSPPGDVTGSDESPPLVWKPFAASNASPLEAASYGRIVYQELSPPDQPTPPAAAAARGQAMFRANNGRLFLGGMNYSASRDQPPRQSRRQSAKRALHLRTGEVVPCEVIAIDDTGVMIRTESQATILVPHAAVKAVQLAAAAEEPLLTAQKRARILTLPRMQKNSPPTHLFFSVDGDILRGRLVAMSDEQVVIELRLEPQTIERRRIARIVWLHPDEMPDQSSASGPAGLADSRSSRLIVQAVKDDGKRITLAAESLRGTRLTGERPLGGRGEIDMNELQQLFLGGFIIDAARALPLHRWRLQPAAEPRFAQAAADGGTAASGTDSDLVGQPAPSLELPLLNGQPFRLREHRGHCVVLDFWATWSGPCLLSMPQVEKAVAEFAERDVRLFAVNLQETPEQIQSTLERRGWNVTVVVDRDGVAAARYQVAAVPHTVVIDSQGNVACSYVGPNPDLADQLRQVLAELTSPDDRP